MVVYFVVLNLGDIIFGMNFLYGGYLIYGSFVNFFGKFYNIVLYGVDFEIEIINYDEVLRFVKEYRLKFILVGVLVYLRVIDFKKFREIVDEVGVYLMVDMVYIVGFVAVGFYLLFVEYVDFVIIIIYKIFRGLCGGFIFCKEKYVKLIDKIIFSGI